MNLSALQGNIQKESIYSHQMYDQIKLEGSMANLTSCQISLLHN